VEHDGESGELLLDLLEHVESQGRRNQTAGLRVTGALLGSELVSTVAGTDRDSQRIATCAGGELDHFLGLCIVRLLGHDVVLDTGQHAKLGLNGNIELVSIVYHLLGEGDILLERQVRAVDHH